MFDFNALIKSKNRPLVMGILNITPDSFSDGGEAFTEKDVINKLKLICNDGADIVDVGACSTAPMNELASEEEEISRLKAYLPIIIENSTVPVSVDTFRPRAAEYALSLGAEIINDESGTFKDEMASLVKKYNCGWIFMHTGKNDSKSETEYPQGVTADVLSFFEEMKNKAINIGIDEGQLSYDCGIGFGKTRRNDLELLKATPVLSEYSPLLIGVSRKRVIGEITGESKSNYRVGGSVGAAAVCAFNGAEILRVHDVKETVQAIKVSEAIKKGIL